jgi:hypothetical protein
MIAIGTLAGIYKPALTILFSTLARALQTFVAVVGCVAIVDKHKVRLNISHFLLDPRGNGFSQLRLSIGRPQRNGRSDQ